MVTLNPKGQKPEQRTDHNCRIVAQESGSRHYLVGKPKGWNQQNRTENNRAENNRAERTERERGVVSTISGVALDRKVAATLRGQVAPAAQVALVIAYPVELEVAERALEAFFRDLLALERFLVLLALLVLLELEPTRERPVARLADDGRAVLLGGVLAPLLPLGRYTEDVLSKLPAEVAVLLERLGFARLRRRRRRSRRHLVAKGERDGLVRRRVRTWGGSCGETVELTPGSASIDLCR